jgi:hypothetical protein
MLKRLAVLAALAIGSVSVAHAIPLSGTLSLGGSDNFTSSSITFTSPGNSAFIFGGGGANTGAFSILTNLNPVTMFPTTPANTPLPYSQGANTVPPLISPIEVMTTTQAGETFSFFMTSYNANFVTNSQGCIVEECLNVTGMGFFTGTGVINYDNTPGAFVFSTQLAAGQTNTTFAASGFTLAPVPEPASLLLVGSGFLGIAGVARRKFRTT